MSTYRAPNKEAEFKAVLPAYYSTHITTNSLAFY
jgi:hypothetical protein